MIKNHYCQQPKCGEPLTRTNTVGPRNRLLAVNWSAPHAVRLDAPHTNLACGLETVDFL